MKIPLRATNASALKKPENPFLHQKTIGVAGLGQMGFPMACRLHQAGFKILGHDIVQKHLDGPIPLEFNPDQFAQSCDLILSVVRDEEQNLELCFGNQAIFKHQKRPQGLIISSTVSPGFVHKMKELLPGETLLVDAPMSGAPHSARSGNLTFMLGGPSTLLEDWNPLFECMGQQIHQLGELGAGMSVKVLNNYVASSSVVTIRRVLEECSRMKVSPEKLLEVMSESSGGTWFGNQFKVIDWAREGYSPDNTIGILEKDVNSFLKAIDKKPFPEDVLLLERLRNLKAFDAEKE